MNAKKLFSFLLLVSILLAACTTTTPQPTEQGESQAPAADQPVSEEPAEEPAKPVERTKVQVISWWDFTSSNPLQELKAGFEAANPDLEIEYIQVGSGYADKVLTMIAGGGDLPDVMMLAMDKVPLFADRGAIISLDPYITDEYKNNLYPVVLDALTYNGSVYAAARDVSSKVMFLNVALFEEAGVDYPSSDWTWDDFRALALELTKTDASGQPSQWGFYFPKYTDGFYHFLRQNNGGLVDESGTTSTLGTPESIEALSFLRSMIVDDKSIPTESQAQQFGSSDSAPFIAGKVAMIAGSLSTSVALNTEGVEYKVVPLPSNKQAMNTAFVNAWTIPAGAKNPDLSWRVLEYFSGPEGQQIALNTGMGLPGSKGVDTSEFLAAHPDNHYFLSAFDTAEPFPTPLYGADYFNLIRSGLELMWIGDVSVEDAVAPVVETGNQILSGQQ